MKITTQQLKQIIKEEKAKLLNENFSPRSEAFDELEELRNMGISDTAILEYILGNHLSGAMAYEVISGFKDEL